MKTLYVLLTVALLVGLVACGGEAPDELEQASQGLEAAPPPALDDVELAATVHGSLPSPDDDPVPVTRPVQGSEEPPASIRPPFNTSRLDDPVPIRGISDLRVIDEVEPRTAEFTQE